MTGRLKGGLLLVLAAIIVFVTTRLANPVQVAGQADAEPPAPPPAVQTCIQSVSPEAPWTNAGTLIFRTVNYVPCGDAHQGEIFYLYNEMMTLPQPRMCAETGADAASYLGVDLDLMATSWQPYLNYGLTEIGPDQRQYAAGQRWTACVLTYGGAIETMTQSVRGTVDHPPVPVELSSCQLGHSGSPIDEFPVSCATVHTTEILGVRDGAGTTSNALAGSCQDLAVEYVGSAAVSGDPDLSVDVVMETSTPDGPQLVQVIPAGTPNLTECVVHALHGRTLATSLRDLGTAQIPWTP